MTVAIYARKSTDQNGVADDAKSVTRQIEHAKAFAARTRVRTQRTERRTRGRNCDPQRIRPTAN